MANNNDAVSDLSGLEHATNLTRLELSRTSVADLSALTGLTSLEVLKLNNSSIDSLQTLSSLTNLEMLWFNNTDVDDISTLSSLTALREVRMHRRQSGAQITDISALLDLADLEFVEMRGITIDATLQAHIDTLKSNRVDVRHD